MQIILMERVENLGQMGDVVTVKPGFARNFLLPQKKAMRVTKGNLERFGTQRAQLETENLQRRGEAESVAEKLDGLTITVLRQAGENGQLYGSVTARDIAAGVSEAGFTINRTQVRLDHAIKTLGLHAIRLSLHPEVGVVVTANVAKTDDEAALQLQRGGAITEAELADEEDAAEAARAAAEAALALADDQAKKAGAVEGLVEDEVAQKVAQEAAASESDTNAGEAAAAPPPEHEK